MSGRDLKLAIWSFEHLHADSYARCLAGMDGVDLVGVVDEDERRARDAAERFGMHRFADSGALWAAKPDGVVVCSANARHREMVEAAAGHGAAVLCEKPLATTLADAEAMIKACAKAGIILATAFPCRFNMPTSRARDALSAGRIGKLLAVAATNRGLMPGGWFSDPKAAGGGAVIDHTAHVADLLRWFTGEEIEEVYAEAGTLIHEIPTEDCGLLSMRLSGGAFATLDCSWSRPTGFPTWGDVTMRLVGTEGVMDLDAFCQKIEHVGARPDGSRGLSWESWGDDMSALMLRDFVDAIRRKRPPLSTGEDGYASLAVTVAAYESIRTGAPAPVEKLCSP